MKAYTDLLQSKKLAKILPVESADMYYWCGKELRIGGHRAMNIEFDVPCWSLAALLDILPKIYGLKPILDLEECSIQYSGIDLYITASNIIDACVETILKLHELKMI